MFRKSFIHSFLTLDYRCEVQYEYGLFGKRSKPLELRPSSFMSRDGKKIIVKQNVAQQNDRTLKRGAVCLIICSLCGGETTLCFSLFTKLWNWNCGRKKFLSVHQPMKSVGRYGMNIVSPLPKSSTKLFNSLFNLTAGLEQLIFEGLTVNFSDGGAIMMVLT